MTVEVHLVRHGESKWNLQKRLTGWTDVALTERGRLQAQALRDKLSDHNYTQVWSSDLQRAWQTAALAGFKRHERTAALREFDFGVYEGKRWDQLPRKLIDEFVDFEHFIAPDGESGAQFYQRIDRFLDKLGVGTHLIFAHGGVVRSALRETEDERFVPNAGITRINWTERRFLEHIDNPYADASE